MSEPLIPARQATESRTRGGSGRRLKLSLAVAAVVLVCGLGLALTSVSLRLDDARDELEARLSRLVGHPLHVDGAVDFTLLPMPRAVLSDLRVETAGTTEPLAFEVDRVEADFALLPALFGRAEIRRVALIRPELGPASATLASPDAPPPPPPAATAPLDQQTATSDGAVDRASGNLRLFLLRFEGLRELEIRQGLFRMPGRTEAVSNINARFDWPGNGSAANLTGEAVWNGQPVRLESRLERPLPFAEGDVSPLRLALSSSLLELGFDGSGAAGSALRLEGGLRLSTPSLSRAVEWIGRNDPALPDFGAFSIDTQIQLVDDRVSLGSASLDIGGNTARGALEADLRTQNDAAPSITGTLAFSRLDFARFSRAIAPPPRTVLDLQRPLRTAFLRDLDLDLRLSAREADLGRTIARDVAATIKATGGVGTLDIGDMSLLGGRGDLRITLDTRAARPDFVVTAGLRDVTMADLTAMTGTSMPLTSGRGEMQLTLRGPATNWGEIALASRSDSRLRVREGQLAGVARGMLRTPGPRAIDPAEATAEPFARLELNVAGVGPRLRIENLSIAFEDGEARAGGTIDLRTGELAVAGRFDTQPVEAAGVSNSFTISKPIRFKLDGEWPKPTLTVDASEEPS